MQLAIIGAEPHFIDTDIRRWNVDYKKLDQYLKTITIKKGI